VAARARGPLRPAGPERGLSGAMGLAHPARLVRALLGRLRDDSLFRNSVLLMATTVANSGLGFVYWFVAARAFPASEVGLAAAVISAMTLTSLLSNLGLGTLLVQRLPGRAGGAAWSGTVNTALGLGVLAGLLSGVAVAALAPLLGVEVARAAGDPAAVAAFAGGVALWTACTLVDFVFVAERAAGRMLVRNVAFSVLKVPLLLAPVLAVAGGGLAIFASWLLAAAASVLLAIGVLLPRLGRGYRRAGATLAEARAMVGSLAGHHLVNVGAMVPMYVLPIVVTARLSAADTAYFYTTWMACGVLFVIAPAVASSLFAEGSHSPAGIAAKTRSSARLIAILLAPTLLVYLLAGRHLLGAFGPAYAEHGLVLMWLLLASAVPDAVTSVAVSVLRLRHRMWRAALLRVAIAAGAVGGAWALLPSLGIAGAGVAWLAAQVAGALAVGAVALLRAPGAVALRVPRHVEAGS